jgi:hypothetical protein
MAAKGKKILLENLNTLVLNTILGVREEGEEVSSSEIRKQWESLDFQRKLSVEVFGIKNKAITRNKSAYMFFFQDIRKKVAEENPKCRPNEIMSLVGKKWREELTIKQKSKYYEQADNDKERYLASKELEKRRSKTPSKLSSYFLFCEDERPKVKKEFPDMKTKEVTAECGKRWNDLKAHDQKKYKFYVEKASSKI